LFKIVRDGAQRGQHLSDERHHLPLIVKAARFAGEDVLDAPGTRFPAPVRTGKVHDEGVIGRETGSMGVLHAPENTGALPLKS
jgi:hypothetical protein